MKGLWMGILWAVTSAVQAASPLVQQLTLFFQHRDPHYAEQMTVEMITAQNYWPPCDTPRFSLAANARRWGRMTVVSHCKTRQFLLQVNLKVVGDYYVSRTTIPQGSKVTAAMLAEQRGRIDSLPARAWLTPPPLPLIALQTIKPGRVLTKNQFRRPWLITRGQPVDIVFEGVGFRASYRATALDNAASGQNVRVRTANGQVIVAKASAQGKVTIE